VQGSLRNSRRNGLDIVEAYQAADEALARMYPDQRFATAVFGRLELDTGRWRWIAAGHPPPLLVRNGRVVGEAPTVPSLPLGLRGGTPSVNELVLERGDALLVYTDGVTEARGRDDLFGDRRLRDHVRTLAGLPAAAVVESVAVAVSDHLADRPHDDIAVVAVQFRPEPA
jgi:serine phosphatase RsbU (regulator of sigma subunit)